MFVFVTRNNKLTKKTFRITKYIVPAVSDFNKIKPKNRKATKPKIRKAIKPKVRKAIKLKYSKTTKSKFNTVIKSILYKALIVYAFGVCTDIRFFLLSIFVPVYIFPINFV